MNRRLTVAELIAELSKCPPDARVWTAGCDCNAEAGSVDIEPDGTVMIQRFSEYEDED